MIDNDNLAWFVNSYLLVGVGGFVGSILRFAISEMMQSPQATFTVNAAGSLLLGITMAALSSELISKDVALLLGTGILGAFTTMSTFSVETVELWDQNQIHAVGYVAITMIICPLLAFTGWKIGEFIA